MSARAFFYLSPSGRLHLNPTVNGLCIQIPLAFTLSRSPQHIDFKYKSAEPVMCGCGI
jgi:hypothetical protein